MEYELDDFFDIERFRLAIRANLVLSTYRAEAVKIGITPMALHHIVNKKAMPWPTLMTAILICRWLGVPLSKFLK